MDELEAVIWDAMRRHNITATTPCAEQFVGEVLRAATAWAAGDSDDVTLRRRQVLARDGWRHAGDDHLQLPGLRRGPDR